jgi:saccharopine dehydrogenase-like NADP-dependent oxidoreductase
LIFSVKIGKAIRYTINQWDSLIRYIEDGNIQIDNNAAERQIKPFVIGRKNWLFNNSHETYSLIKSHKAPHKNIFIDKSYNYS